MDVDSLRDSGTSFKLKSAKNIVPANLDSSFDADSLFNYENITAIGGRGDKSNCNIPR